MNLIYLALILPVRKGDGISNILQIRKLYLLGIDLVKNFEGSYRSYEPRILLL